VTLKFSLTVLDFIVIYLMAVVGTLNAIWIRNYKERQKRKAMIEMFIDHVTEQIKTEEDFKDITKRLKKEMGENDE
jgi:hypothetical protein